MPLITLTTDFGSDSPYVAAMKGVILSIHPAAALIDVTHGVPPQDIRTGMVVLDDACRWFPRGTIHLAVVDPGVGTERRIVCLESGGHLFIGPDNGLLTFAIDSDLPTKAYEIVEPRYRLAEVSPTFHGRDIMAPAAAHLSLGVEPGALGPPCRDLVRLELSAAAVQSGRIAGDVLTIDSFGNVITNVTIADLERAFGRTWQSPGNLSVICGPHEIPGVFRTYGQTDPGRLMALVGSSGRLELAVAGGNAASRLAVDPGEAVIVEQRRAYA